MGIIELGLIYVGAEILTLAVGISAIMMYGIGAGLVARKNSWKWENFAEKVGVARLITHLLLLGVASVCLVGYGLYKLLDKRKHQYKKTLTLAFILQFLISCVREVWKARHLLVHPNFLIEVVKKENGGSL